MSSSVTSVKTEFLGDEYFGRCGAGSTPTSDLHAVNGLPTLRSTIALTTLSHQNSHLALTQEFMSDEGLRQSGSALELRTKVVDRRHMFLRT